LTGLFLCLLIGSTLAFERKNFKVFQEKRKRQQRAEIASRALPVHDAIAGTWTDSLGILVGGGGGPAYTAGAGDVYTVPVGTALYHGSHVYALNPAFDGSPIWFSPDPVQALGAGRKKAAREHAADAYLWHGEVNTAINLLPLSPCGLYGITLLNHYAVNDPFTTDGQHANNGLMGVTNMFINGKILDLCEIWYNAGHPTYDGWRSPWDQDELMLCPHAKHKVTARRIQRCSLGTTADPVAVNVNYAATPAPANVVCANGNRFSYTLTVTIGGNPLAGVPTVAQCPEQLGWDDPGVVKFGRVGYNYDPPPVEDDEHGNGEHHGNDSEDDQ